MKKKKILENIAQKLIDHIYQLEILTLNMVDIKQLNTAKKILKEMRSDHVKLIEILDK